MSKLKCVEIICDGNPQVGYGHINRTYNLAKEYQRYGIEVIYRTINGTDNKYLPKNFSSDLNPDILLIDVPQNAEKIIKNYLNKIPVCALDYFSHEVIPDLVISIHEHDSTIPKGKRLHGFEYFIIRKDILNLKSPLNHKQDNIIIMLGGGDILNLSVPIAEKLSLTYKNIVIIKGPFAKNIPTSSKYDVYHSPKNLPELIKKSNWAITNGGGSLFEMLYLGIPVWAIAHTKMEETIIKLLQEKNCLLGTEKNIDIFTIDDMKIASTNGQKLIDGKGTQRIIQATKELL